MDDGSDGDAWWEPPLAGTEVEHLVGALERLPHEDGVAQPVHASDGAGTHASLRRLLCDVIEEYGRHTGHADLLREQVDGRVGEDPPLGWRPVS